MRIKSYFSHSVEDAIGAARQELGEEAMLVNSRKAPPEARHLGIYEVVFATDGPLPEEPAADPGAPGAEPRLAGSDRLSQELSELKKELENMRRTLTRTAFAPAQWLGAAPDAADAYGALTAAEVPAELARAIVQSAETRCGSSRYAAARRAPAESAGDFESAVVEEVESRFKVEPLLGRSEARPRIVALLGPPGAGKTTTLVKLAVNYGLAARRPVVLLSLDTYRVAAADQLRSYAGILGAGFQVLETVTALAQAIEEHRGKDLIFIDTPGAAAGEVEHVPGLAAFLSTRGDIDTHLVLSSSTKPADLARMVDQFEDFRPRRLLFTKLDETASFGPIFSEAVRTDKPLSFFGTGQRIPEDLETATRRRLTELLLSRRAVQARSAA